MKPSTLALVVPTCLALVACPGETTTTGDPTWQSGTSGVADASSGTEAEKYFPMVDGHLYHYKTEALREGPMEAGALMMKVHRSSSTKGELRRPTGTQTFEYTSAGIATVTKGGAPAFLLKTPLEPGNTWLGPQGGKTSVSAKDVAISLPAGDFKGCLQTLEERGGDSPMRIITTLCPDVGIVRLEVQAGPQVERADLVYYGPPIDIGPEGLKRVE